ncbi:MAG TPA: thioredoxin fold domain-containing protein [Tepidisphaeraceae bacterium]|nr:thioredoxin fold domain-containing protein [Tepidisphaeraceae bacterium]
MQHFESLEDYGIAPANRSPAARYLALLIVACIAIAGWRYLGPQSAMAGAGWSSDWDAAVQRSKSSGKPALVLFTADWCPACRQFESETLANTKVQQYLRENYTLVAVDLSDRTGPNVDRAREFNVSAIPTLIVYDRSSQEKARTYGMPPNEFMQWLGRNGSR